MDVRNDRNKNYGKVHHVIEEINARYTPISGEDDDAVLEHTPDRMGYTYGYHSGSQTNPFPFSEEKDEFAEQAEFDQ